MQELSMDFSPDESIQSLLRSASVRLPKEDGGTLSRRAEQRVRRSGVVVCNISSAKSIQQKAKQAKLRERRQRIKEKKAAAITTAKAKKATKEAETEVMLRPANIDETRPSKRPKATSGKVTTGIASRPSASLQAEVRKRTKAAQRSKKQPQTNDGAMPA
jgi:hypothetical protein